MRRIIFCVLPILICAGTLCGCNRNQRPAGMELSRRLLIEAIGLDGDGEQVTMTLLTMNTKPAPEENGAEQNANSSRLLQFTAKTVGQAAAMAEETTGQTPFFAHARLLLIGKDTARNGVLDVLDFFLRNRSVRSLLPVCVAADTAASVLSYGGSPAPGTAQLLENVLSASHACGKSVQTPLFSFLNRLFSDDTEALCPILKKMKNQTGEQLSVSGTAVFSSDKLRRVLTEEETTALLLLQGKLPEALITLNGQTPPVTCRIRKTKARFRKANDAATAIDFTLQVKAELTEADGARYPVDEREKEQIAAELRETLAEATANCFFKLYNGVPADLCRLRRKLYADGAFPDKKIQLRSRVSVSLD